MASCDFLLGKPGLVLEAIGLTLATTFNSTVLFSIPDSWVQGVLALT